MKNLWQKSFFSLSLVCLFLFSLIISPRYFSKIDNPYVFGWTTPSTTPPGGNITLEGGGGTPAGSTGYVQFNNSGAFGADAGLFWDNSNKRLGIGTTTPGYKLAVEGSLNATSLYISGTQKNTVWDGKEPGISAGTTAQYWRGDKTWQTFNTAAQAAITGGASTITTSDLTISRALISNSSGKVAVSGTISDTELGYLDNVSSNIQTQLNAKAPLASPTFTGTVTISADLSASTNTLASCAWTAYTCDKTATCPAPKIMAGVGRDPDLTLCGTAPKQFYQMAIYCCHL